MNCLFQIFYAYAQLMGHVYFQLKEFLYSFPFHIKIKILDLRHMDVLSRKLGIEL